MGTQKSKIAGLAKGIGGLAAAAGISLTPGNLTTGLTSDGKMTFAELMALPSGPKAPPQDEWVRRFAFTEGTIRKQGSKITVEFNDDRADATVDRMDEARALLGRANG